TWASRSVGIRGSRPVSTGRRTARPADRSVGEAGRGRAWQISPDADERMHGCGVRPASSVGGMPRVVRFAAPRVAEVVDEAERPLGHDDVRLRTLFSGISAGTELTAYRGSNPYLAKQWDNDRRLFIDGEASREYPLDGWGYEEVGEVAEVGPGA